MIQQFLASTSIRIGVTILFWSSAALLLPPATALAASCTDGVDCYCDTVSDASLLLCQDFESADFYENTVADWAATQSGSGNRGDASAWFKLYGNGISSSLFRSSDSSPRIGPACGYSYCVGMREYCSTAQGNLADAKGADCWGPNVNADSMIDMQRSNDFRAEISSLQLSGGRGATSDIGAGRQHYSARIAAGQRAGILGEAKFGRRVTEVGVTMAIAYSSNIGSTGILNAPWKHDEWYGSTSGNGGFEHWNMGLTGTVGKAQFPYSPFMFNKGKAACDAAISRASVVVGSADCSDVALRMGASPAVYDQARDFPFGTWGCHQAHLSGLGTSNMTLRIWHNGRLVFHLTNFDARSALYNQDYSGFFWNSYSNANQGQGGIPTTQTAFRYQDNIHVRNGAPVSCSAIGFDGTPSPTDPGPAPQPLPAPVLLP